MAIAPTAASTFDITSLVRKATFARLAILAAILTIVPVAQGQTLNVLYKFTGHGDGATPYAGVTLDRQGRIYGTTCYAGANQRGVVYRLTPENGSWVFSPIYSFGSPQSGDGSCPLARGVFGPDGLLYGTTSEGGTYGLGTVFSLQPPATTCRSFLCPWKETVLHNFDFSDGTDPGYGDLVFDRAGNIYGTAFNGGQGGGLVFELSRSGGGWTESVLWEFTYGSDGAYPAAGVIFDNAGNLYGTTTLGGANDDGTVYELSPSQSGWTETTLYSFTNADNGEGAGLLMDAHGNLFGIAGVFGAGVAYQLTPQSGNWYYKGLQAFTGTFDVGPVAPPTFDSQGNLYGPLPNSGSYEEGEIFKLTPSGNQWIYTPFYQFGSTNVGAYPYGAVVFDANGNMYGTAAGNIHGGYGTVWEITP